MPRKKQPKVDEDLFGEDEAVEVEVVEETPEPVEAPAVVKKVGTTTPKKIAEIGEALLAVPYDINDTIVTYSQPATGLNKTINLKNACDEDGNIDVNIACIRLRGMGFR